MTKKSNQARSTTIDTIMSALADSGYAPEPDVRVTTPAGNYKLAFGARRRSEDRRIAIAVQHQDDSGSAEKKVLWHVAHLAALQAVQRLHGQFRRAVLVWSGSGWSQIPSEIPFRHLLGRDPAVDIVHVDDFCSRARELRL
jgi:hypothetical protein